MPLVFHYISIISPCLLVIPEYQHIKLLENHWTPPQPKHMRGSAGAAWFRRRQSWQHSSSEKILRDPWDLKCKTMQIYIYISADTGLCQGRGGAWDHQRCRTWLFRRLPRQQWHPNPTGEGTKPTSIAFYWRSRLLFARL